MSPAHQMGIVRKQNHRPSFQTQSESLQFANNKDNVLLVGMTLQSVAMLCVAVARPFSSDSCTQKNSPGGNSSFPRGRHSSFFENSPFSEECIRNSHSSATHASTSVKAQTVRFNMTWITICEAFKGLATNEKKN